MNMEQKKQVRVVLKNYYIMKRIISDKSLPSTDIRNVLDQRLREFLDKNVEDLDCLTQDKNKRVFTKNVPKNIENICR